MAMSTNKALGIAAVFVLLSLLMSYGIAFFTDAAARAEFSTDAVKSSILDASDGDGAAMKPRSTEKTESGSSPAVTAGDISGAQSSNAGTVLLPSAGDVRRLPVIMYGDIGGEGNVSAEELYEQLTTLLENGYTPVSFAEVTAFVQGVGNLPERPVIVAFGDGYMSMYSQAYPILCKTGVKATVFVIGVSVGQKEYRGSGIQITPHFSYAAAAEMVISGLVSVESHSYDMHAPEQYSGDYPGRRSMKRQENESEYEYTATLTADNDLITADFMRYLGYTPSVIAYPGGEYGDDTEKTMRSLGYLASVSDTEGTNIIAAGAEETLYGLYVHTVTAGETVQSFMDAVGRQ